MEHFDVATIFDGPVPCGILALSRNECSCEVIHMKMCPLQVYFHANRTHIHLKGLARGLV